jgi:energy-coupling factor transporter ATP-binding protein EcfA2
MTAFPMFKSVSTSGYGLYPGTSRKPDLSAEFHPGLTLVLGANGLGKTTLVNLIYRMCAGIYELPKAALQSGGELGGKNLRATKLASEKRQVFADRVHDRAADATATLEFELGGATILVERSLRNLELLRLERDGDSISQTEDSFHKLICQQAEVSSFVDWILLLRHLVFYFEDRRSLVWDPTAQRQILRLLFLTPRTSQEWRTRERDVLKRDSNMRNLRYAISTQETEMSESEDAVSNEGDLRKELAKLEKKQEADQAKLDELSEQIVDMGLARDLARLEAAQAESQHESALRNLERHQLTAIERAFPGSSETARYLISQLISEEECLACGSDSPKALSTLKGRIDAHRCVVCNSPVKEQKRKPVSERTLDKAAKELERAAERLDASDGRRHEAETEFDSLITEIEKLKVAVAKRSAEIEAIAGSLPQDGSGMREQRSELALMRAQLEEMKRDLTNRRNRFARFVKRTSGSILDHADDVRDVFEAYAQDFLLEDCRLLWNPHKTRIGETGASIPFPAFELEIGGSDFDSPVRRTGPEQVSESQREFIDLAFRMALIEVAGSYGGGSIVIDAPESSLDAVFVDRAAEVLVRFAEEEENRVVITSNLIEGNLIPHLIRMGGIKSASSDRVVDLLKIAAPTAATKQRSAEYAAVRDDLFERAKKSRRKR